MMRITFLFSAWHIACPIKSRKVLSQNAGSTFCTERGEV